MNTGCTAVVTPREAYGSFHSRPCGRPKNDEEFPELCKMHGNARRKEKDTTARRAAERQTSEELRAVGQGIIDALAGYGMPNPERARSAYLMSRGRGSYGGYTGGIDLTREQAEWLVQAFVNGEE